MRRNQPSPSTTLITKGTRPMSSYQSNTVDLAKLYKRTSAKGTEYFSGRLGLANVVMFRTEETSETSQEIWILKVSTPQQKTEAGQRPKPAERPAQDRRNDYQRPFDDAIPF